MKLKIRQEILNSLIRPMPELRAFEKAVEILEQNRKDCEGFSHIEEGDSPRKKQALKELLTNDSCNHKFYDVHPSFGDYERPSGRRCEKCGKQEWY